MKTDSEFILKTDQCEPQNARCTCGPKQPLDAAKDFLLVDETLGRESDAPLRVAHAVECSKCGGFVVDWTLA